MTAAALVLHFSALVMTTAAAAVDMNELQIQSMALRGANYTSTSGLMPQSRHLTANGDCHEGSYIASPRGECTTCSGGEARRRRATECTDCPKGRFQPASDTASDVNYNGDDCMTCSGGEVRRRRATECTDCPKGRFQPLSDAASDVDYDDACMTCSGGEVRRRRATECTDCPKGRFQPASATATDVNYDDDCMTCSGQVRRRRATECTDCPPGRFQPLSNVKSDECLRCVGGEVVDEALGKLCRPCSPGTYDAGDFSQCQIAPREVAGPAVAHASGDLSQQVFSPKWVGDSAGVVGTLWTLESSCGGKRQTWVLFGDINDMSTSLSAADYEDAFNLEGAEPQALAPSGDSVQIGSIRAGVFGSPGYSLDLYQLSGLVSQSEEKFDLMIQYGGSSVYEKCISGFSKTKTYREDTSAFEYSFINNEFTSKGAAGIVGENGMFGSPTESAATEGMYATFSYNGGDAGHDFWQFSRNGVLPASHADVDCGFTSSEGWKSCPRGDNAHRMRYYIRSDQIMKAIVAANSYR